MTSEIESMETSRASGDDPEAGTWSPSSSADEDVSDHDPLVVGVEGFEGPLDLLLALARTHKIDLAHISILALVEQYLAYIAEAQKLRIEIAADYLVMAAWLAYLKSRLILPREDKADDEPSAEEMAKRLTLRLLRLEAMRRAIGDLMARSRLGHDVFPRGMRELRPVTRETQWSAEIYDLLKAYSEARRRTIKVTHTVKARTVWSIKDARQRLEKLIGQSVGTWVELDAYMATYLKSSDEERTVVASSFGAMLELAREGVIEVRQDEPFAPIYMRKRGSGEAWTRVGG